MVVGALAAAFGASIQEPYNSAVWGMAPFEVVQEGAQTPDAPLLAHSWVGEEDGVLRGADLPPMVQMVL